MRLRLGCTTLSQSRSHRTWQAAGVVLLLVLFAVFAAAFAWQARLSGLRLPGQQGLVKTPAPGFRASTSEGRVVALADYHGKKTVVLYFWASVCEPCVTEVRELNSLYKKYHTEASDFEVLAISNDLDVADVAAFASAEQLAFPALLDPGELVARAYRRDALPMMVIIDRNGTITYAHTGHDPSLNLVSRLGLDPAAALSRGSR